jgi:hypothetical protein
VEFELSQIDPVRSGTDHRSSWSPRHKLTDDKNRSSVPPKRALSIPVQVGQLSFLERRKMPGDLRSSEACPTFPVFYRCGARFGYNDRVPASRRPSERGGVGLSAG